MTVHVVTILLLLLAPHAGGVLGRDVASQGDSAKILYSQNCLQCHGVRGLAPKGIKATFPKIPTFDSAFSASHTQDSIVKVLTHGKSTDMPSFSGKLTPAEMATVAKYVRGLASK